MITNLLAIILLTTFIVVNITKRLHIAYLIARINKSAAKFVHHLQVQQSS